MSEEVDSTRLARFRVIDPPADHRQAGLLQLASALAPLVLLRIARGGHRDEFLMAQLVPTFDNARMLRESLQLDRFSAGISMRGAPVPTCRAPAWERWPSLGTLGLRWAL